MNNETHISVHKKRKTRYRSQAWAYIIDILEDAVVKDISGTGCCLLCEKQVKIQLHEMYVLHILPEDTAKLGKFELLVQSRWAKSRGDSYEIGFLIISSPVLFSQYNQLCRKRR